MYEIFIICSIYKILEQVVSVKVKEYVHAVLKVSPKNGAATNLM